MTKAKLTSGQVTAAVIAGVVGNLLFTAGFTILGFVLLGGLFVGLLGAAAGSLFGQFTEGGTDFLANAGGVAAGIGIGFAIGAVVVMLLGVLISGWILKGGKVRRPWAVTWTSVLIVAVLSLPLLLLYFGISGRGDGSPVVLVAALGTLIVGVLVWLWMTWAHRGPAPEAIAGTPLASSAAVEPPAPPTALPATEAAPPATAPPTQAAAAPTALPAATDENK